MLSERLHINNFSFLWIAAWKHLALQAVRVQQVLQ